jgi:hypothetical protein
MKSPAVTIAVWQFAGNKETMWPRQQKLKRVQEMLLVKA